MQGDNEPGITVHYLDGGPAEFYAFHPDARSRTYMLAGALLARVKAQLGPGHGRGVALYITSAYRASEFGIGTDDDSSPGPFYAGDRYWISIWDTVYAVQSPALAPGNNAPYATAIRGGGGLPPLLRFTATDASADGVAWIREQAKAQRRRMARDLVQIQGAQMEAIHELMHAQQLHIEQTLGGGLGDGLGDGNPAVQGVIETTGEAVAGIGRARDAHVIYRRYMAGKPSIERPGNVHWDTETAQRLYGKWESAKASTIVLQDAARRAGDRLDTERYRVENLPSNRVSRLMATANYLTQVLAMSPVHEATDIRVLMEANQVTR